MVQPSGSQLVQQTAQQSGWRTEQQTEQPRVPLMAQSLDRQLVQRTAQQ
jgi:hypothetical protein